MSYDGVVEDDNRLEWRSMSSPQVGCARQARLTNESAGVGTGARRAGQLNDELRARANDATRRPNAGNVRCEVIL